MLCSKLPVEARPKAGPAVLGRVMSCGLLIDTASKLAEEGRLLLARKSISPVWLPLKMSLRSYMGLVVRTGMAVMGRAVGAFLKPSFDTSLCSGRIAKEIHKSDHCFATRQIKKSCEVTYVKPRALVRSHAGQIGDGQTLVQRGRHDSCYFDIGDNNSVSSV